MSNPKVTEEGIRHALKRLSRSAADASTAGHVEHMSVPRLLADVMEIVQLVGRHKAECEHERAMALRDGMEDGNLIRFEYDGRRAEVYPNAHNSGQTFGLRTNKRLGAQYDLIDKFHGFNWTSWDALAAAKAWVNDGVMPGEQR